jgi:hypothetical protein
MIPLPASVYGLAPETITRILLEVLEGVMDKLIPVNS